jgi:hypothetical protein
LCSTSLILLSALLLLLRDRTDIHHVIWTDTRCIRAV